MVVLFMDWTKNKKFVLKLLYQYCLPIRTCSSSKYVLKIIKENLSRLISFMQDYELDGKGKAAAKEGLSEIKTFNNNK